MNIQEILNCLPHRYPFLLLDKVIELQIGEGIIALKNVTFNEPFFQGHFPQKAIMPGVLIIEALAQAAGVLAYRSTEWDPRSSLFYLGSIGDTKFKRMVLPGDQLFLEVKVLKQRPSVWKFACQAKVNEQIACITEMTCMEGKVGD